MGLVIDRGSIRAYSGQFKSIIPTISLFGYPVPLSLLSIATAPPERERGPVVGAEGGIVWDFPPAEGTGPPPPPEQGEYRDEEKEKRTGNPVIKGLP